MALRKKTKTIDFSMFFQSIDSFEKMNGIDLIKYQFNQDFTLESINYGTIFC